MCRNFQNLTCSEACGVSVAYAHAELSVFLNVMVILKKMLLKFLCLSPCCLLFFDIIPRRSSVQAYLRLAFNWERIETVQWEKAGCFRVDFPALSDISFMLIAWAGFGPPLCSAGGPYILLAPRDFDLFGKPFSFTFALLSSLGVSLIIFIGLVEWALSFLFVQPNSQLWLALLHIQPYFSLLSKPFLARAVWLSD